MRTQHLEIPEAQLRDFCAHHAIRRLALFGSVLRSDFTDASDIDVLVEFAPGERVGLIRLGTIEAELSDILGRKVDLNLPDMLSRYFRDKILTEAETLYDAA